MVRWEKPTKKGVREANRIRGEGWTISFVRRRPSKTESERPPADGEAKPGPDGPDATKVET